MDRWIARVLALAVIGLVATVAVKSMPARTPLVVSADASVDAQPAAEHVEDTFTRVDAGAVKAGALEAGLFLGDLRDPDEPLDAGRGALPANAPRQVHLGIVLLTFAGAQGAPPTARARGDAKELATRLAEGAKADFHGAVQRGDNGSSDDVGRVPRGVLEAPVELAVFSLAAGETSDVIETPRGFWIVKRID